MPATDIFTEEGQVYHIPSDLLDKYIKNTRKDRLWCFTIKNPTGDQPSYSGYITEVDGITFEKNFKRQIYFDSKYFFCLCLSEGDENKLLATIGFTDSYYGPLATYLVVQTIQGKKYREKELKGLRWDKLLLAVLCDWAFQTGFYREVNVWCRCTKVTDEVSPNLGFKMHYRVTPARLGFKPIPTGCMRITKEEWLEKSGSN